MTNARRSQGMARENCGNPSVTVLFHDSNQGVGGAMITGYEAALGTDAEWW